MSNILHLKVQSSRFSPRAEAYSFSFRIKGTIFSGWYDSDLRDWLVSHNLAKSNAQLKREEMIAMIGDKYVSLEQCSLRAWRQAAALSCQS